MKQKLLLSLFFILCPFLVFNTLSQSGEIGYNTSLEDWSEHFPITFEQGTSNEFTLISNVDVSTATDVQSVCGISKVSHFRISSNSNYMEGYIPEGLSSTIKTIRVGGSTNNDTNTGTIVALYSEESDYEPTSYEIVAIGANNGSEMVYYDFTVPANTKSFRLYRRVSFGGQALGESQAIRIAYFSYTLDGTSESMPSISSLKVNNQNVDVKDEMSYTISYGYSNSTVDIEFQVSPETEINIDGNDVNNNNGVVSYNIPSPELLGGATVSLAINVSLEDQIKVYSLDIVRGEKKAAEIVVGGESRIWDFTNWSDATLSDLAADTENWRASSSTRYQNLSEMNGELIANGNVIKETEGLNFAANTSPNTRIDHGSNGALSINSSNVTITINNLEANQKFSVTVQSSNISANRTITLSNSTPINGDDFAERSVREFEISEDGSATLKIGGGGFYIYSIEVAGEGSMPLTAKALEDLSEVSLTGDITSDDIEILNDANLTSINLESASSLAAGLDPSNPNCLVFATSTLAIATTDAVSSYNLVIDKKAENITLTDNNAFYNPTAFTVNNISYTRTYENAGWSSLCLPFELSTVPTGVTVKEFTDVEGETVIFDEVTELDGNTPYIAHVTNTENVEYTATDVTVLASSDMAEINRGDYAFKGVFTAIAAGDATGLYLLNSNGQGFGRGTSTATVPSFRSYIEYIGVDTGSAAQALALGNGDGGTTGLDAVEADELVIYSGNNRIEIIAGQSQEVVIYGLDGRVVNKVQVTEGHNTINGLAKGIYLLNNQKVAVK